MIPLVRVLITLGLLVVVPLGLTLIPTVTARATWYIGAIPAAISLWLPHGLPASALATCLALAVVASFPYVQLRHPRRLHLYELLHLWALLTLGIAATALVAERSGHRLFGFSPPVLALTAAHFQFAGFAAALIAGLLCRERPASVPARAAALCVPLGTVTVLAGFFTVLWIQFAGAAILATGMWLVSWVTWRDLAPSTRDPLTRALLLLAAATLIVTMLLALDWSLGRAARLPHLSLAWMAATHGTANALGFALCAVLAWRRLQLQRNDVTR